MVEGATHPAAKNYNPLATVDDGSGFYLRKVGDVCMAFSEISGVRRENITVSYSPVAENWVFFHGYHPDQYIEDRNQLLTVKNNQLYKHNAGPYGLFYEDEPQSFMVDLVLRAERESILSAVHWVSEILLAGKDQELETFTHITIWNNNQCTGRIPLSTVMEDLEAQVRKGKGAWSFNDFRDVVINHNLPFLKSIFEDYAVDETAIDVTLPWYEKELLVDDHFIVRLEFSNGTNNQILLHQYGATLDDSY